MSKPKGSLSDILDILTGAIADACAKVGNLDKTNLPEYLRAFKEITELDDRLADLSKILHQVQNEMSSKTLPEIFKNNNVDSLTTAGKKFSLNIKMRASIPLDKQEKGFAWLIANGYAPLIKEAVNSQSLSSAINGYFEAEAKLPPDDAISIYNQEYISIRKA